MTGDVPGRSAAVSSGGAPQPEPTLSDDERKRAIAGLYDRTASTYGTLGPPLFERAGRRLVELADLHSGDRVLDVATGRGAVLFPAAERVGRGGLVIGIDLSEGMVKETTQALRRERVRYAAMAQVDADHLAFGDASFDAVLCSFSIFLFPSVQHALAECLRVLRPGGWLGLAQTGRPDPRWAWYDQLLAQQGVLLGFGSESVRKSPDLETALHQAGFVQVRVITEEFEGVFPDEAAWWAWLWTHGARTPLERMSPEHLARFQAAACAQARTLRQPDGLHQAWQLVFTLATRPPAQP